MSGILPIREFVESCIDSLRKSKLSTANQISSHNETIKGLQAKNAAIAAQMLALKMQQKQNEDELQRLQNALSILERDRASLESIDLDQMTLNISNAIKASLPGDVIKANECHTHYDESKSHPFTFPPPTSTKVEDENVEDEMDFCGLDAFDSLPPSCTLPITFVQKSDSNTKTPTKTKPTRRIARHKYDNMSAKLDIFDALPYYYVTHHNREAYNHSVNDMQNIVRDKQNTNPYKTTALLSLLNQYNKKVLLVNGKEPLTMAKYLALCNEASL